LPASGCSSPAHEQLLGDDEIDDRPLHPLTSHVPVPPLSERDIWTEGIRPTDVAAEFPRICAMPSSVANR
jgi:hypothetical protein